jgi:hypothetical protein
MMIYNRATIIIQSHASKALTPAKLLIAPVRIDQDSDHNNIEFWTHIG